MNKQELRVPQILEMEIEGHTQTQIAEALGVSRMTTWKDRQTPLYDTLKNAFLELYINGVRELATHTKETIRQRAIEEMGRSIRAGVTRQVHRREEKAEVKIHLHDFNPNPNDTPET